MGKDTHLVNIYLKIHNKRPLTMDDLRYLAEYAPECFEKTCKNVVYNRPETKPIMEPGFSGVHKDTLQSAPISTDAGLSGGSRLTVADLQRNSLLAATDLQKSSGITTVGSQANSDLPAADTLESSALTEQDTIEAVLENLMRLESDCFPVANIQADEVKNLLGNLYMELLFPHNDKHSFFQMTLEPASSFDRKA